MLKTRSRGRAARPNSLRSRPNSLLARSKGLRARSNINSLRAPDEEISQLYENQSQRVFHVDFATSTFVLPLGLGKFGHVLKVDFRKLKEKGQFLLIAEAVELLPHG